MELDGEEMTNIISLLLTKVGISVGFVSMCPFSLY